MEAKTATKVTKVESYKDSQVNTIVVKGKLVLIKHEGKINFKDSVIVELKSKWFQPIIISETESIKVDDWYILHDKALDNSHILMTIYQATKLRLDSMKIMKSCKFTKILALPEQFSPKHLQAIIDGKLKSENEVLVECELIPYGIIINPNYKIKLTNNHIKLFPVVKKEERILTKMDICRAYNAGKQNMIKVHKEGELTFISSDTYYDTEFPD